MNVLISDRLDESAVALLQQRGLNILDLTAAKSADELIDAAAEAQGWIIRSGTRLTDELLQAAQQLRVIGRAGVGVDNIDVAAATRRGIAVLNTPAGNTMAAVEHTMALLLALARNIPGAHQSLVAERSWERTRFTGVELYGKRIGILGLGKIGGRVAARCRGMEMQVQGYDPYLTPEKARALGVDLVATVDELLSDSDFISLHLPATADTRNLINAASLQQCKAGVRIINCARGSLIDEAALADALKTGHVAGAALDVFANEPPDGSPLLVAPNVVLTPHLGASTVESQRKVGLQIAEQVADALQHGVFREAVNIPVSDWARFVELKPRLIMAERLGRAAQQLSGGPISRIEVEYLGEGFDEIDAINHTLLKGLLQPALGDSVNAVNAPLLAEERGIELVWHERRECPDYQSLIRVRTRVGDEWRTLAGTTFSDNEPRLVAIDEFEIELFLLGVLLVFGNYDRPGVIGDVGTTLGKHSINVAHFSLGRSARGEEALGVIAVDDAIPANVMEELAALPNMRWVRQVELT